MSCIEKEWISVKSVLYAGLLASGIFINPAFFRAYFYHENP